MQELEITVPDPSNVPLSPGMVESRSAGTFSSIQRQDSRGLFVDRGVGSPRLVKSASTTSFASELKLDSETKVMDCITETLICLIILSNSRSI